MTPEQQRVLLQVARSSIEASVRNTGFRVPRTQDPVLLKPTGAFVTLHLGNDLRGCVGYFEPLYPLIESVSRAAVKAALEDPRFSPVGPGELKDIRLEISALSARIPLTSAGDIVIGRDGIMLETEKGRGVLLPQVAVEYGWDTDTFFGHIFRKCGVPPAPIGTPGYAFFRFSAEIFSEPDGTHQH